MYPVQDFSRLLGSDGFSDNLLKNHFTLYEGYVKNTNTLLSLLDTKEPGTPEYSELQRRFGWEWNGMRLHELYFGNMRKGGSEGPKETFLSKIESVYGDFESWKKKFVAVGSMRGIGWAVLAYDREGDELFNIWVGEHDMGHLSGAAPILVMDVFEHAFALDYGIQRKEYIEAFFRNIDWDIIEKRL